MNREASNGLPEKVGTGWRKSDRRGKKVGGGSWLQRRGLAGSGDLGE